MNKIRYIPIIGLAALLSSCSLFGGVKAPKFDKEGDEVKYEKFIEKLTDAYKDSELNDSDSKLGDRIVKYSYSSSGTYSLKRGKKEIEKSTETSISKGEQQFDYDSLVSKSTGETKTTEKSTDQEGSSNETVSKKTEEYYQFGKVEKEKYLIEANAKTKTYSGVYPSSDDDKLFDQLVRQTVSSAASLFSARVPYSEEAAKDYTFYNNKDAIFTYSLVDEDEDKVEKAYKYVTTTKIKVQLDITDKKQAVRYSSEVKTVLTYTDDINGYKEDDVVTREEKNYAEITCNAKEVKLKEVDLDDYVLKGGNSYNY